MRPGRHYITDAPWPRVAHMPAPETGALPYAPGKTWYRSHYHPRGWSPNKAVSLTGIEPVEHRHPDGAEPGYSAFDNPHDLHRYLSRMGWDQVYHEDDYARKKHDIVQFPGSLASWGADSEPTVMPGPKADRQHMTWDTFKSRLAETPHPDASRHYCYRGWAPGNGENCTGQCRDSIMHGPEQPPFHLSLPENNDAEERVQPYVNHLRHKRRRVMDQDREDWRSDVYGDHLGAITDHAVCPACGSHLHPSGACPNPQCGAVGYDAFKEPGRLDNEPPDYRPGRYPELHADWQAPVHGTAPYTPTPPEDLAAHHWSTRLVFGEPDVAG